MLSKEQRELRRKYLGSSDAPAVLGVDPYRSAADVWLEKTGKADDFAGNADTDRGTLLEPVILNWAEGEIGLKFIRDHMKRDPQVDDPVLAANFDGFGPPSHGFIVEAKSSVNPDEWGEPGSDSVPERVIIQVHHAMYVAGPEYRLAYVPVLLPGYRSFDFRMYRVERDDALCAIIVERATFFMRRHVRENVEPDDFKPSLEILKRIRREPNKTVAVPADLVDDYLIMRAARLQAEEHEEHAQAALLTALGDAECGHTDNGVRFTYMTTRRRETVVKACEYRTLRFPKSANRLTHQTQAPTLSAAAAQEVGR